MVSIIKIDGKEYKTFNINEIVKVKLTQKGKLIYSEHQIEIQKRFNRDKIKIDLPLNAKIDNEGFSSFQLWRFMEIFGSHIYCGAEPIIEECILYLPEELLHEK